MNIFSSINDKTYDIDIKIDPERENWFIATVDGHVTFYEFYKERGRINSVVHNNQFYKVLIRNRQQDQLEQLLEEFGAGMGGTATDTRILAPMPGKILGISVKEGEKIELGRVVLVLEAMKMENEISSTVEGKVAAIKVKVGDSVQTGDVMIETQPL
jgi:biotin carboxyl carrier protein